MAIKVPVLQASEQIALLKSILASSTELVRAVREVMSDHRYPSPPLPEHAIEAIHTAPHAVLTAREREVLSLAAQGLRLRQIASALSISPRTAETHRANVMRKLGLHSQTDLVRHAMREGILSLQ